MCETRARHDAAEMFGDVQLCRQQGLVHQLLPVKRDRGRVSACYLASPAFPQAGLRRWDLEPTSTKEGRPLAVSTSTWTIAPSRPMTAQEKTLASMSPSVFHAKGYGKWRTSECARFDAHSTAGFKFGGSA